MDARTELNAAHHIALDLPAGDPRITILRMAAEAAGTTLHDFVLDTVLVEAERTLADRRRFTASPQEHQAFLRLLDEPTDSPKLSALAARRSVFDQPFDAA